MNDEVAELAAHNRIKAGVQQRTFAALRQWWSDVYPTLLVLRKARGDEVDWKKQRALLIEALINALIWGSTELTLVEAAYWESMGQNLALDAGALMDQYLLSGQARLQGIAAVTQDRTAAEIARWTGTDETAQTLIARIEQWYGSDRAERIADGETAFLWSDNTVYTMRQANSHRWQWIHLGTDDPCVTFCLPNVNKIFHRNDPMPPYATHVSCHCVAKAVIG